MECKLGKKENEYRRATWKCEILIELTDYMYYWFEGLLDQKVGI